MLIMINASTLFKYSRTSITKFIIHYLFNKENDQILKRL